VSTPNFDDPEFLAFERSLPWSTRRSYGPAAAREILNIGNPKRLTRMVREGKLRAFRVGEQKFSYLGRDLAWFLFTHRVIFANAPTPKQEQRQPQQPRRGRPRSSPVHRMPNRAAR
jgi:hypothetical protein